MLDVLTLGQKEIIRNRSLTQCDAIGEPAYCVDCLTDLPALWWFHRCEIPEARPVALHKTRTWQDPQAIPGRYNRRGRPMFERAACAMCSCGWSRWQDNRTLARWAARKHREANAA